ncbi:hypothetical protein MJO28_013191 [Puccinia striiformis f. sp. tritici]|uniref:Uncharacterized protein n=1 Tax=Puccinia striiformis f. sp. tritici TaxID=168172 RepID=A0ACC0DY22_9BASI|nr:hypothetical protein Pst134EB_025028 [Puccinia striiformis f. sp. tritici]KAI7940906.1 hypothetical protein MJO28_013191 [Puccinia striiformis f. sp. tritici]
MTLLAILVTLIASICLLEGLSAAPIAKEPLHGKSTDDDQIGNHTELKSHPNTPVKTSDNQVKPRPLNHGPPGRGTTNAHSSRQKGPQPASGHNSSRQLDPPGALIPTPGSSTRKPLKFTSFGGAVLLYSSEFM